MQFTQSNKYGENVSIIQRLFRFQSWQKCLSYLSSMRNMFLDILTQAPLPVMLLGPMAKGSGKPKWNHFPVQLLGKEQISEKKIKKFKLIQSILQ